MRRVYLSVRVTALCLERLRDEAKDRDCSVSEVVRERLGDGATRKVKETVVKRMQSICRHPRTAKVAGAVFCLDCKERLR